MEDIKARVFKTIREMELEQGSCAYFELVCSSIFGEITQESERKLKSILKELEESKLITINGDRIGVIKKCELLLLESSQEDIAKLNLAGLELVSKEVDIGHGCNILAYLIEFMQNHGIETISAIVTVGCYINDIKGALEGFNWLKDIINKVFGKNKPTIYYCEDLVVAIALNYIIEQYEQISIEYIHLLNKVKTPLGLLGYYAVQNYGYEPNSLGGSPESIYYLTFELTSDELESDREIVTCQVLSNGRVISFNNISISTGPNLSMY